MPTGSLGSVVIALLTIQQGPHESVHGYYTRNQALDNSLEAVTRLQTRVSMKPLSYKQALLVGVAERGLSPSTLDRQRLEPLCMIIQESSERALRHESSIASVP